MPCKIIIQTSDLRDGVQQGNNALDLWYACAMASRTLDSSRIKELFALDIAILPSQTEFALQSNTKPNPKAL